MTNLEIAKEVYLQIIYALKQVRLDHRVLGHKIEFSVPENIEVNGQIFWYRDLKDDL